MTKIDLENKIKHYAAVYYAGNPEISDEEFDELVDKLREIDPYSTVLNTVGWGSGVESDGKKTDHKYQLIGSLSKVKEVKNIPDYRFNVISAKLDGLSAVLYYTNGKLEKAVTRGNGVQGIDITDKIVRILNGKTTIYPQYTCAVRGELVISVDDWALMIKEDPSLKNPRNTAAGIINRNEITEDLCFVSLVVYNMIGFDGALDTYNQDGLYNFLESNFEKVCPHTFNTDIDYDTLELVYNNYRKIYPCDGLVIGNAIVTHEKNDAMKYDQIAFKFPAEKKITTVRDIDWSVTRTGRITPVLIVDPIELSGAIVSRCSAFNAKFVKDNNIGIGTVVEMMRSNEVIPYITRVVSGEVEGGYIPDKCPECGDPVEIDGTDIVCNNPNCVSKNYYNLTTWMNNIGYVDGIGTTLKIKFCDELGINCVSDIYDKDFIMTGSGAQRDLFRKVLNKLLYEEVDATDALCALNIPRLGRTTAEKLAVDKDLLTSLMDDIKGQGYISEYNLGRISKVTGPATAESIENNQDRFSNLMYVWDRIKFHEVVDESNFIKVAITGKLSMKRADFEKLLYDHGFVNAGIGKDTKYLITDNPSSGSSKNQKADKLGIEKITEADFRDKYGF